MRGPIRRTNLHHTLERIASGGEHAKLIGLVVGHDQAFDELSRRVQGLVPAGTRGLGPRGGNGGPTAAGDAWNVSDEVTRHSRPVLSFLWKHKKQIVEWLIEIALKFAL